MKSSPFAFLSGAVEKLNLFIEKRDQREQNMLAGLAFVVLLLADFFILMRPVIFVFSQTTPQLIAAKQELRNLEDDSKNKKLIDKQWLGVKEKLANSEKQFIAHSEIPSLLENLSKLAQNSQVKIITLKPLDASDAGSGFVKIPIRMSAVAATHDLGRFLAFLEGGDSYFKVTDLKIMANASDDHRHTVELTLEAYAKNK